MTVTDKPCYGDCGKGKNEYSVYYCALCENVFCRNCYAHTCDHNKHTCEELNDITKIERQTNGKWAVIIDCSYYTSTVLYGIKGCPYCLTELDQV